jgi:phosphatidylserine/phosphatidylglycerophosphate/cardiolipin synthase-like enzyme
VNVYEFSSTDLARPLIDAHRRGVNVTVLVEGGPVGGISPEEKTVIWTMNQSGIPVFQMGKTGDTRLPYRFDHAKYLIIDDQAVLLTSENFKTSGFPPQGRKGNRGWGICIENEPLAAYFENMFTTDIGGIHIVPVTGSPGPAESPSRDPYTVEYVPYRFSGAQVTPVIAPDTSYQIVGLLNSANSTIDIEQAYITNESANLLNPFLGAAINASRRGVRVRILLDSYWYNTDDEKDNDEMVALINTVAATENLPLEARCADLVSGNIEKIHNKGVIIDNRSVLVSSINWNTNSPDFNREAGVIIVHDGVAGYFRNVFDDDWQPVRPSLKNTPDYFKFSGLIVIVLLLFVLYALRRYRR